MHAAGPLLVPRYLPRYLLGAQDDSDTGRLQGYWGPTGEVEKNYAATSSGFISGFVQSSYERINLARKWA